MVTQNFGDDFLSKIHINHWKYDINILFRNKTINISLFQ